MQPVVRRVAARVRVLGCVGLHPAELPLEQTFKNREELNSHVVNELRRVGVEWGIECTRYEVKDIDPPLEIMSAMKVRRCDAMRWVDGWVARRVVPAHPPIHHSVHPILLFPRRRRRPSGRSAPRSSTARACGRRAALCDGGHSAALCTRGVQPCVVQAIALCGRGMQPCVTEAIALCDGGYSPVH